MKDQGKDRRSSYFGWGLTAFLVVLASLGVLFLLLNVKNVLGALHMLAGILMPVIYGTAMAYLMSPVYNRSERLFAGWLGKLLPGNSHAASLAKAAATLVAVVLLCTVAIGLVSMVLPQLYRSVVSAVNAAPPAINRFYAWLNETISGEHVYKEEILQLYQSAIDIWTNFVDTTLKPNVDVIVGEVFNSVRSLAVWVYNLVIGLIVMVYLLNIKGKLLPQIKKLIYALFPEVWAVRISEELRYIHSVFGGFIIGKILDSIIIGLICFVVLSILKMPYTLLVSVIVGVTNVIPFFGPFIGAVPSVILIAIVSPRQGIYFLLFVLLLQQFDGNILGPKILGDKTGISSFFVLFSILLFGGLFGFVGMIIGVPTWAVLMHLLGQFCNKLLREKGLPLSSQEYRDK